MCVPWLWRRVRQPTADVFRTLNVCCVVEKAHRRDQHYFTSTSCTLLFSTIHFLIKPLKGFTIYKQEGNTSEQGQVCSRAVGNIIQEPIVPSTNKCSRRSGQIALKVRLPSLCQKEYRCNVVRRVVNVDSNRMEAFTNINKVQRASELLAASVSKWLSVSVITSLSAPYILHESMFNKSIHVNSLC